MQQKTNIRKQMYVDPKVQGALVLRVVSYWIFCLLALTLMMLCWRTMTGPMRMFYTHFDYLWFHFGPAVIGSFILLPLVVIDIVRLSNRFVGPLLRLRRSMRALARGEEVSRLEFRENDFWQDFAQEFNAVASRLQKLEQVAKTQPSNKESEEKADDLVGSGSR